MPASSRWASFCRILGAVPKVVNRRRDRTASHCSAAQCPSYSDNRRDKQANGHEGNEAGHRGHGDEDWSEIDHCEHAEPPFEMPGIIRPEPGLIRGLRPGGLARCLCSNRRGTAANITQLVRMRRLSRQTEVRDRSVCLSLRLLVREGPGALLFAVPVLSPR